jgi:hypothetical protein
MNSRLTNHEVRLRGLSSQSAQADFVPFQPANSFAGVLAAKGPMGLTTAGVHVAEGSIGSITLILPPSPQPSDLSRNSHRTSGSAPRTTNRALFPSSAGNGVPRAK